MLPMSRGQTLRSQILESIFLTIRSDVRSIAGYEQNKIGSSYDAKKKRAVTAVKFTDDSKIKRMYALNIKDFFARSLQYIFIKTLHTMIHKIKSWIRTTYSRVSEFNLNRYFSEFCFRINRSQGKATIFNNRIRKWSTAIKFIKEKLYGANY